ncbi:unnamed protein product, partial [Pylaiella littoralis]
ATVPGLKNQGATLCCFKTPDAAMLLETRAHNTRPAGQRTNSCRPRPTAVVWSTCPFSIARNCMAWCCWSPKQKDMVRSTSNSHGSPPNKQTAFAFPHRQEVKDPFTQQTSAQHADNGGLSVYYSSNSV